MYVIRLESTKQSQDEYFCYDKLLVFDTVSGKLTVISVDIKVLNNNDAVRDCKLKNLVSEELSRNSLPVGGDFRFVVNPVVYNAYSAPFKIYMDLTYRCNAACPFCLYKNTGAYNTYDLDWETCRNIIDTAYKMGVFAFKFGGGEPMLYPHFWDAVNIARSKGIFVSTSTNSLLIDEVTSKKIYEYGIKISISVEGLKQKDDEVRGSGHFDKAISTLNRLKGLGCNVCLQTNVMPRTFADIPGLIEIARSVGVTLKLRYLKPVGRALENGYIMTRADADEYIRLIMYLNQKDVLPYLDLDESMMLVQPASIKERLYRGIMCGAGNRTLHISPERKVSPCIFMGDEYVAGEIGKDGDFMCFWRETTGKSFHNIRSIIKPLECRYCNRVCAYECPALRIKGQGSNDLQGVNCLMSMVASASADVRRQFNEWLDDYEKQS